MVRRCLWHVYTTPRLCSIFNSNVFSIFQKKSFISKFTLMTTMALTSLQANCVDRNVDPPVPPVPAFQNTLAKQYECLCLTRRAASEAMDLARKKCDWALFNKVSDSEDEGFWRAYDRARQAATDANTAIWNFCERHGEVVRRYVKKHGIDTLACDNNDGHTTKFRLSLPKKKKKAIVEGLRQTTLGFVPLNSKRKTQKSPVTTKKKKRKSAVTCKKQDTKEESRN